MCGVCVRVRTCAHVRARVLQRPSAALTSPPAGYWVISTPGKTIPLRQPYRLVLGAAGGERVGREVASLRAQDLGVNFQQ